MSAQLYSLTEQQEWLHAIALGDEMAFNRLYHHTSGMIYTAVITYVKAPHVAEEIVQEVYTKLWQHPGACSRF